MKKHLLVFLVAFYSIYANAQEEQLTTDEAKVEAINSPETIKTETETNNNSTEKKDLRLKFRDKIVRPLGKDWYVYVGAGYGIPFMTSNMRSPFPEIGDRDWFQKGSELRVKPIYGTNGGGFCVNLGWGHMFNKHIGIDVMHTLAWHPLRLDAQMDLDNYTAYQKTKTFALYIAPHLVMRWDNGKRFGITGKAGVVLPMFGSVISQANVHDEQGRLLETIGGLPLIPIPLDLVVMNFVATAKTQLNPTVGISTSIGFDFKASKKVTLFAEIRTQLYTISLKETKFQDFVYNAKILNTISLIDIKNVSEAPEFLIHYVYKKELDENSNTARYGNKSLPIDKIISKQYGGVVAKGQVDLEKPMEEFGQKLNASSLYFNMGVRLDFDVRTKKLEDKLTANSVKKSMKKDKSKKAKNSNSMKD